MDRDSAVSIFNNPSLVGYLDYTHMTVYRVYGEFEFGFDERYDEIALALAFVAIEMAIDEDLYEIIPPAVRRSLAEEAPTGTEASDPRIADNLP
jgi:hypothetical protein